MFSVDINLRFKNFIVKNINGHYEFFKHNSNKPFRSCDINELNITIDEVSQEFLQVC